MNRNSNLSVSNKIPSLLAELFKNPTNVLITDCFFWTMLLSVPMHIDADYVKFSLVSLMLWAIFYYWLSKEGYGDLRFSKHSIILLIFYLLVIVLSFFAWPYALEHLNAWGNFLVVMLYLSIGYYVWDKFDKFVDSLKIEKQQGE